MNNTKNEDRNGKLQAYIQLETTNLDFKKSCFMCLVCYVGKLQELLPIEKPENRLKLIICKFIFILYPLQTFIETEQ